MSGLDTELQPGDELAGYRVTGIAGRGGMGVVYRAEQLDLQRPVALKLIATPLARDEAFRERFVRESRAAAAIDHPNVIPVYSAGEDDGRLYLAMRFVDGEDLRTVVQREGPLDPTRAATIIAQVANALDAAHARGLVHRDIKPANVLLDHDHAYLTDFGLTKRLTGETTMTGSGRWVGTLGYIAPEQIRGAGVDARADVYALGCLLFYILTGVAPYRRDSDEATLYAHLNDPAPDATALSPAVPAGLAAVVARALEKDPDDRFLSAGDLGRAALAAVGDGPVPPPERVVARGAAAPGGFADDETFVAGGGPDAATRTPTAPTALAPGAGPGATTRSRGWIAPVLSLVAGAAVVLIAVLLLTGGNDDNKGSGTASGTQTSTTPAAAATAHVVNTYKVDPRPNAIAYAHGRIWVGSAHTGHLIGIATDGKTPRRTIRLPWKGGTTSIAAGFGSLWVTNGEQARLVRIDPATGALQGDRALGTGEAVVVTAGEGAVWVGRRAIKTTDPPSSIVKVDPRGGKTQEILFGQEGVSWITTGGGYVWVPNRRRARVSRIDPRTGERKSRAIGLGAHQAVFGANQIWVTNYDDGTVTQNNRALDNPAPVALDVRGPLGIGYSAHTVWVASQLDNAVVRIDPAKGEVVGDPIEVGRTPFAIAAHGKSAWVTNLASATVTRIDLG
ncbi:serine-threonine kinase [Baekduia alba]|uniref:serine/threonine-protein kinase n=1 Tax=Baekduia alba TaxID=2997333 RepID=UPI0023412B91|nr:serine/threonine-protein kinase [Baekduia alba]WCB95539.1 serine-threonine kinase [Baekduia alba]